MALITTIPTSIIEQMRAGEPQTDTRGLLRLMALLSPVFPVGSFSYSHGLEQAVHDGFITCREEMELWLRALLQKGTARNDTIFLAEAWRGTKSGADMTELAQLSCAIAGSREREMETCMQGLAFLHAMADYGFEFCPNSRIKPEKLAYPVAVGAAAAGMGIGLTAVAAAYLHAFVSNLVQAGLRLVPLGQRDGVRLLRGLEDDIGALSQQSPGLALTDLGSAAVMSEICAMRHETLYSRIFRS